MELIQQLEAQREYFKTKATWSYDFRKEQLKKLKAALEKYEDRIFEALDQDLRKSKEECWITENGFVLTELKNALDHLNDWMKPEKVGTNLPNFPSKSYIYSEPLGVVLIISPWNYPVNLLFTPLVGAIAAGNCVVLKASESAPAIEKVMGDLIKETFEPKYISYVSGIGSEVVPNMMDNFRFNHVFYTGSTGVGQGIYESAAKKLVPVTLELGGKSPCIVDEDANISVAAKRICFAKFSNSGQTCVAPDYVLVHPSKKEELIAEMKKVLLGFFGEKPEDSYDYGKIISVKAFDRLSEYLTEGNIRHGGATIAEKLYIAPTLLDGINTEDKVMKDEIFGPILPILTFNTDEAAIEVIACNPNPLAMYVFTENSDREDFWIQSVPFGGGCVNNASLQLTNDQLPFGGIAASGLGHYHGIYSFRTFSHQKSIMKTSTWLDPSIKYPPYKGQMFWLKKLIG